MLWTIAIFLWLTAYCNTQILTLNKTSQSSDYKDGGVTYSSERAVDGNLDQCSITKDQTNSWWKIDLLGVCNISCISIYNIKKDHTDIKKAWIYIGNSPEKNCTTNTKCKNIDNFQQDQWNNFTFNPGVSGRYVHVFLPEKVLILCEVMIYGTTKESPFVLVQENKTWEEALYYCRSNYEDLASIVDNDTQAWAEMEAVKANTPFVWLGLHYTCTLEFWFWVADHRVEFSRWATGNKTEDCDRSGAMKTQGEHLWFSMSDYEKFYFICAK